MKLALVTDAWHPQVNGVVTTLNELVQSLQGMGVQVHVIHPGQFEHRPCPGYAGIDLAVRPAKLLARMLDDLQPDAVHVATEGPLGWAARKICLKRQWAFTTAFHTKFPEILHAARNRVASNRALSAEATVTTRAGALLIADETYPVQPRHRLRPAL